MDPCKIENIDIAINDIRRGVLVCFRENKIDVKNASRIEEYFMEGLWTDSITMVTTEELEDFNGALKENYSDGGDYSLCPTLHWENVFQTSDQNDL